MLQRCLNCMEEYDEELGVCPVCGSINRKLQDNALYLTRGTVLKGRYLIGGALGSGGFGTTYLCWDYTLEQKVAIKEYLPSEFATRGSGQSYVSVFGGKKSEQFSDGREQFLEEAKKLVKFQNEPGIVRVYDSFEENNTAYIVMEYLDGETLGAFIEREKSLPVKRAIELILPVILSLKEVHKAGIIHRDISPDNIIITKEGEAKLIDFGAARFATTSYSRSLTVIIKQGYSPEEQYRSRGDQGPHTDVYALGAVLYKMVTGVTPPDAMERRAYYESKGKDILERPSHFCNIEKNRENAILNAMNPRIESRTATIEEFFRQLTTEGKVKRVAGKIAAIDTMKWPLWLKIAIASTLAVIVALIALILLGVIGFKGDGPDNLLRLEENMTRVPSVINLTTEEAQRSLNKNELESIISGREESATIPADYVLRQSSDAGTVVEKGSVVELYISALKAEEIKQNVMPNVSYYSEAEAIEILESLGLNTEVEYEESADVANGLVIRTDIDPDEVIDDGQKVTVYVSGKPFSIDRTEIVMLVGDEANINASGGNGQYDWTTSDKNIALVDNGIIKALSKGNATITVGCGNDVLSCTVTVQNYPLVLDTAEISMFVGEEEKITASGGDGQYNWNSSDENVVRVYDGKVIPVSEGKSVITVSSGGETASCNVTVHGEINLTLNKYELNLYCGDSEQLFVEGAPDDAKVTWECTPDFICEVDDTGKVTARMRDGAEIRGESFVTASVTVDGRTFKTEACLVQTEYPVLEFTNMRFGHINEGESVQLTADIQPADAKVVWTSSNPNILSIDENGYATGKGIGRVRVKAHLEYNGYKSRERENWISVYGDSKNYKKNGGYIEPPTLKKVSYQGSNVITVEWTAAIEYSHFVIYVIDSSGEIHYEGYPSSDGENTQFSVDMIDIEPDTYTIRLIATINNSDWIDAENNNLKVTVT